MNETKNIVIVLGVMLATLWIFRMKKGKVQNVTMQDDLSPEQLKENASIAKEAYANAVRAGEPKSELDKLNRMLHDEYGVRVYIQGGSLIVTDRQGNVV